VALRHRGWVLIAGLVGIAVVGTVIALRVSAPKLSGRAMAEYMPERDAAVLFVDVASIRSSGILEKLAGSTVAEEPEYKAFLQQTGFDYKRDLDRLMASLAPGEGPLTHYFLLEGRFDWDKLKRYATSQGGACHGDICSVKGSTSGRIVSFYPVSSKLMALASSPNDQAARDVRKISASARAYEVPEKPLWLYVPRSTLQKQTGLPSGTRLFTRALEPAKSVMFSLGSQTGKFLLQMDVTCVTTEDAVVMKNQLEGLTQLLQKFIARERQTPNATDLSGILTSGTFERSSEHVIGRWPIDKAVFESVAGR